jgi:hypothetical protein
VTHAAPDPPAHIDGPRTECPGCVAADARRDELVKAARDQLAHTDPTAGQGDQLARLILAFLGEP